jgi:hypothetical protein
MPPHVVGEPLRTPLNFPAAENLEGLVIHKKHPAWAVSCSVAERRKVNAVRPAMHRMWPAISCRLDELFRLDDLVEFRIARIRLGVDDVDARGAEARHDKIAPLDMRVWRIWAKAGAASVPAEMVQLVAGLCQVELAHDLRIALGFRIDVDHGECVRHLAFRIESRHEGNCLGRRFGGQAR